MNIVVIPARFGSTRFPGKPLVRLHGHTMIWHVYHRSLEAATIDEVWVATDDERIFITYFKTLEDFLDPSVAKVVRDSEGFALYFSRSPIPYSRDHDGFKHVTGKGSKIDEVLKGSPFFRHVGLYGYHKETLLRFCNLPPSKLENMEKLEQLRALEYGVPVYTVQVDYEGVGVDTPEDAQRVEAMMREENSG